MRTLTKKELESMMVQWTTNGMPYVLDYLTHEGGGYILLIPYKWKNSELLPGMIKDAKRNIRSEHDVVSLRTETVNFVQDIEKFN